MPEFNLCRLAQQLSLDIADNIDTPIKGVATLEEAEPDHIAFAESARYKDQVAITRAALVLVPHDFPEMTEKPLLHVDNPKLTFIRIAELFIEPPECYGIDANAGIHPQAVLADGVSIGPCAVVSRDARIGANTHIGPGVFIGTGVNIGSDCRIDANASILPGVTIGNRVRIRSNASIGGEGFGYVWLEDHHHPIPQLGRVVIEDDVEIGCNCCIDRAALSVTRIGSGSKLDNLVHIAHNCEVGEDVILAGQVGFAGSVKIGSKAMLGGQVGVSDHIEVGPGAIIGGHAAVTKSVKPGEMVWGSPAREMKRVMREQAALGNLPDALKRLKKMSRQLDELHEQIETLKKENNR